MDYRSCHPKHVKMGIPYGQALRLRRICELDEVFEEMLGESRRYLLKRGFRTEVVDSQLKRARDVSRTALLDQGYNKKEKDFGSTSLIHYFRMDSI